MPTPDQLDPVRLIGQGTQGRRADPRDPHAAAHAPHRREADGWLERWIASVADLARLKDSHPMLDVVVDAQAGRKIRIGDHWLSDFASSNYLGFDVDQEIVDAVPEALARWGTQPSWPRLVGRPALDAEIEGRLTELLGCEDALLFPTITSIHLSAIPILAGSGTIFLDARAHKTSYDGAMIARSHGATIQRFRHNDAGYLEDLLRTPHPTPRLIALDGVNSMTGNAPDLRAFARLAREHDALLYVDDAHGFGVVGERAPDELCDWGTSGNSLVRHQGETYDGVVLVSGFGNAYGSMLAFLALPTALKDHLKVAASPYLYSGPSPVASLASAIAGLHVNETRGDLVRSEVHRKTRTVLDRLRELAVATPNRSGYPMIEVQLVRPDDVDPVGRYLYDRGIFVTLAAYPLVPRDEVGFRIQVTAANGDDEIALLCEVLGEADERFDLRHEGDGPGPGADRAGDPPD